MNTPVANPSLPVPWLSILSLGIHRCEQPQKAFKRGKTLPMQWLQWLGAGVGPEEPPKCLGSTLDTLEVLGRELDLKHGARFRLAVFLLGCEQRDRCAAGRSLES